MSKSKPTEKVIYCTHCHQLGHYADRCPETISFSPDQPARGVEEVVASYEPPATEIIIRESETIPKHPGLRDELFAEILARIESLEARLLELEKRKKYMRDYQRKRRAKE